MDVPKPHDPRTPLQAARDKLGRARKEMAEKTLGRTARQKLADRIQKLEAEVRELESPKPIVEVQDEYTHVMASAEGQERAQDLLTRIITAGRKKGVFNEEGEHVVAVPAPLTEARRRVQYPTTEALSDAYQRGA